MVQFSGGASPPTKPTAKIYRAPASDIESLVERALAKVITERSGLEPAANTDLSLERLTPLIRRVEIAAGAVTIIHQQISADLARTIMRGDNQAPADSEPETTTAPFSLRQKDGRPRMISPDGSEPLVRQRRNSLLKAVVRGYAWRKELESGKALSIGDIARRANLSDRYVSRMLKFGYLAPDIIDAILNDEASGEAALLEFKGAIPFAWEDQRRMFASVLAQ